MSLKKLWLWNGNLPSRSCKESRYQVGYAVPFKPVCENKRQVNETVDSQVICPIAVDVRGPKVVLVDDILEAIPVPLQWPSSGHFQLAKYSHNHWLVSDYWWLWEGVLSSCSAATDMMETITPMYFCGSIRTIGASRILWLRAKPAVQSARGQIRRSRLFNCKDDNLIILEVPVVGDTRSTAYLNGPLLKYSKDQYKCDLQPYV